MLARRPCLATDPEFFPMIVELVFPASGGSLPTDHAYPLYGALSGIVPAFHDAASRLRFHQIIGESQGEGRLRLAERSILRVRLPDDAIRLALPLAGKRIAIGEDSVRLGVPAVRTLVPAPTLVCRLATFKNADSPEEFLATARLKLADLGIQGDPQLPIHLDGPRAGQPKRRVVRIHGTVIVGYSLIVADLSAADSLRLQEVGLGGRTRMGCGFFVALKEGK